MKITYAINDPEARRALNRERSAMNQVCEQCGKHLGYEYFLGPVCGKCCKANHKRVTGRR